MQHSYVWLHPRQVGLVQLSLINPHFAPPPLPPCPPQIAIRIAVEPAAARTAATTSATANSHTHTHTQHTNRHARMHARTHFSTAFSYDGVGPLADYPSSSWAMGLQYNIIFLDFVKLSLYFLNFVLLFLFFPSLFQLFLLLCYLFLVFPSNQSRPDPTPLSFRGIAILDGLKPSRLAETGQEGLLRPSLETEKHLECV